MQMNLYDMAKQLVANDLPLDPIEFNKKITEISKDIVKYNYVMLLCNERRDFTVFHFTHNLTNEYSYISKELSETLHNRGQLIHADKQEDGAWELWIRDPATNENFAYYLFDYSNAIVEV